MVWYGMDREHGKSQNMAVVITICDYTLSATKGYPNE